jgi:hypothetical protein
MLANVQRMIVSGIDTAGPTTPNVEMDSGVKVRELLNSSKMMAGRSFGSEAPIASSNTR